MLILQRKAGESLMIGDDITIQVISVDGTRVRLPRFRYGGGRSR